MSAVSPHPLVAIQAHLMPSLTIVSVGLVIAWLLLFACKFSLKIFGEVRLRSQNFLFAFTIKLSCFARLGQTLRVIPLAKWVALAYCKLPHLCKILRLAASCTARARLCIRFTTSARSSQRELAQRSALLTQGFAYLAFGCSSSSANFVSKFLMSTLARGFKRNTI